jgi:hypothetical protein
MLTRQVVSALCFVFLLSLISAPAHARLGETEAQSTARYGEEKPELIGASEKPLLEGAKQVAYLFEGWRIRVAFLNDAAVRLEYLHLPDASGPKKIADNEIETILDAEKGRFNWREEKARTGSKDLNALKTMFEGRKWERSDHALAQLVGDIVLTVQSRDVDDHEKKKLGKQSGKPPGKATPAPGLPKF